MPGVYMGIVDKIPMGPFMNKGLTLKTGQTHVPCYLDDLLGRIEKGEVDLSFVVTHTVPIGDFDGPHPFFGTDGKLL